MNYKDVLLNKKCLKHSMNRIQSKDYRIDLFFLALMMKYASKAMDVMDYLLVVRVILVTIKRSVFVKQIVLIFSLISTVFCQAITNIKKRT